MSKKYDVAVVGADGAVGEALLEILQEREFPYGKIYALAHGDRVGSTVDFGNRDLPVGDAMDFDYSKLAIVLLAGDAALAAACAPRAVAAGCAVIDLSGSFSGVAGIPLIVPEVNAPALSGWRARGIVASPGSMATMLALVLKPVQDTIGLERINVSSYQCVSDAGRAAVEELAQQTRALLNFQEVPLAVFAKQIAFNVLPQIGRLDDNGDTGEERQLAEQLRRLLGAPQLRINATAVQVPVFYGHAAAIQLETRETPVVEDLREQLGAAPGVELLDERVDGGWPTPVTEASGQDGVFVGRIRADHSHPRGLNLWVVADNLRKGAALNGVQIAECLVREYL